jgi:hypothetical protein
MLYMAIRWGERNLYLLVSLLLECGTSRNMDTLEFENEPNTITFTPSLPSHAYRNLYLLPPRPALDLDKLEDERQARGSTAERTSVIPISPRKGDQFVVRMELHRVLKF